MKTSFDLTQECTFKAVRSGGKGGQNVNKVSSKVELYFSISDSQILTAEQKEILLQELIIKALTPVKKRIKTKTPKAVKEKRIKEKKIKGDVKSLRRKPDVE